MGQDDGLDAKGEGIRAMRVGTKSVLFGVHNPIIHSFFMFVAWVKLYGWSLELLDPRLHMCFLLHDIGYWGCKSMDGADGERHPELGSYIVGKLFGDDWALMCRWHSGTMVELDSKQYGLMLPANQPHPSKLYAPDKLASPLYPRWLYKLLSCASGEWKEYAEIQFGGRRTGWTSPGWLILTDMEHKTQNIVTFEDWHSTAMPRMRKRAYQFAKDGGWMTMQEAVKQ